MGDDDVIKEQWLEKSVRELYSFKEEHKEMMKLMRRLSDEFFILRNNISIINKKINALEKEMDDQVLVL